MTAALRVAAPGLMTTVQDLGRPGFQRFGIPVSGALDPVSLAAANLLVGNPPDTAALEIAYQGPTLVVEASSTRVAFAGGGTSLEIVSEADSAVERLGVFESRRLQKGQTLRIGALSGSTVGYLAVEGGFAIEPFLGSLSTYTRGGIGGWHGRPLASGDRIPLRRDAVDVRGENVLPALDLKPPPRIRVVLGPQDDYFTDRAVQEFLSSVYTVSSASDRMGMRLEGPKLEHAKGFNIVSDGIAPGSIQVPGNGLPIVLLADRQTTGGYPKVATVVSADLPALGRLSPGAQIRFEPVDVETAEDLRRAMAAQLAGLAKRIRPAPCNATVDEASLNSANLVSGVIDAHEPLAREADPAAPA
jgi:biotin-dependent carboxylase-like uncharacterized protein